MSKIYGGKKIITRAQKALPGDKSVCVNWDAIGELSDQYEVVLSEVKYDHTNLERDFVNCGSDKSPMWMPQTSLMYRIAEARGISGGETSVSEPIYELVDIGLMLMDDDRPPVKKLVGYRVKKYSTVVEEDGSVRRSSICSVEYNTFNRCAEQWTKEEAYTDGYTKPSKFPYRYNNKYKRRAHFQSELKFAQAKAETKAHEKTIRELAGMFTGYKTEDLTSGFFIFAKIRRSRESLHADARARIGSYAIDSSKPEDGQLNIMPVNDEGETLKNQIIDTLKYYFKNDMIKNDMIETSSKMIDWLENTESPETSPFWANAIDKLKQIESIIPSEGRLTHGLYTESPA